jgi:hypothetical protein
MTAREIGRRTTRGKEENGRRTTTALDKWLISPPGREGKGKGGGEGGGKGGGEGGGKGGGEGFPGCGGK